MNKNIYPDFFGEITDKRICLKIIKTFGFRIRVKSTYKTFLSFKKCNRLLTEIQKRERPKRKIVFVSDA